MQLTLLAASSLTACALVAPSAPARSTALKVGTLDKIVGVSPLKNLPADYGFDPLGFAKVTYPLFALPADDVVRINTLRDAELRHGRLAMLAAAAWPIQELLHPTLAKAFGAANELSDGRSPSVLNGGLVQGAVPAFLLATAGLVGYLDVRAEAIKENAKGGADWTPGDFGFDPLNLLGGASPLAVKNMQAKEVNNGRLAMVAVLAYVIQEAVTGEPVIAVSEEFFTPLYAYPWVQHLLTDAFGVASFRI